jgi:folate-dependent phosphoribosylglycinamide formyltransferase PurN
LGRWLGVSHCVGSDLCYWIVTDSGQVVSKTSVEHVTRDDYLNEDMKAKVKEFEKKLVRVRVRVNLTLFYREKIMSI